MRQIRLGELLQKTRLQKELTLADVEKKTRIRQKFLKAIEAGKYDTFYSLAYARGFVKNYAEFLGIKSDMALALFRRETTVPEEAPVPDEFARTKTPLFMNPTRWFMLLLAVGVIGISGFLYQQYQGFLGAPKLVVEAPVDHAQVSEGVLEVKGETNPDVTIFINNEPVAVSTDGTFIKDIAVFKGDTSVTIIAKNRRGKDSVVIRSISVK